MELGTRLDKKQAWDEKLDMRGESLFQNVLSPGECHTDHSS